MGLLVRFNGQKAFLRQGIWMSADGELEARLNQATEEWIQETGGPKLNDADPERTVAKTMIKRLGGRILLHQPGDARVARRMFFERRQMQLPY